MNNKHKIIMSIVIILTIFSACSSDNFTTSMAVGNSDGTIENLKEELAIIKADIKQYSDEQANIKNDIDTYKQELNEIKEEVSTLKIEYESIKNLMGDEKLQEDKIETVYEYFIPNIQFAKNLILEAVDLGTAITINSLPVDFNSPTIKDPDLKYEEYYLVNMNDVSTMIELREYLQKTYTKDVVDQYLYENNERYVEVDGKLYTVPLVGGGGSMWNTETLKLIKQEENDRLLTYEVRVEYAYDDGIEYDIRQVQLLFFEDEGWRVNTFIRN